MSANYVQTALTGPQIIEMMKETGLPIALTCSGENQWLWIVNPKALPEVEGLLFIPVDAQDLQTFKDIIDKAVETGPQGG